ncbi:hypothetical protein TNCV_2993451 [Trichonephila clavipes]|nr:hypothetical protein TNCV_2993451 [Trichonephila clavipes]
MNKIPASLDCSTVSSKEFVVAEDDNVCTAPIRTHKDILEFVQSSKNIVDADSGDENKMDNAGYLLTRNEFADHPAKKEVTTQQLTRKVVPFTSANRIIKKLNDPSSKQYAERNSSKIWWKNLKYLPMWPRRKAVAMFLLTTGHDCLLKHLQRIHVAQTTFCTLCDFREDMNSDRIRRCPALKGSSVCDLYWQAKDLLSS